MVETLAEALADNKPLPPPSQPVDNLPNLSFEQLSFASASKDDVPTLCAEPGCTNEVVRGARGPAPKYCPEHKTVRTPSNGTRAKRGGWTAATTVEKNLVSTVEVMAGGLMFLPTGSPLYKDGAALYATGPKIVHELVVLAENDKRLRGVLEKLAAPGKYGPLVIACGTLVLSLASNHGMLPAVLTNLVTNMQSGGE